MVRCVCQRVLPSRDAPLKSTRCPLCGCAERAERAEWVRCTMDRAVGSLLDACAWTMHDSHSQ